LGRGSSTRCRGEIEAALQIRRQAPPVDLIDLRSDTVTRPTPGILVVAFGPRTIRAVTHLDVDSAACGRAATILVDAAAVS